MVQAWGGGWASRLFRNKIIICTDGESTVAARRHGRRRDSGWPPGRRGGCCNKIKG